MVLPWRAYPVDGDGNIRVPDREQSKTAAGRRASEKSRGVANRGTERNSHDTESPVVSPYSYSDYQPPEPLSNLVLTYPLIEAEEPLGVKTLGAVNFILTLKVKADAKVRSTEAAIPGSKVAANLHSRKTSIGQTIRTELVDVELQVDDDGSTSIKFKGERHQTKMRVQLPNRLEFTASFDSNFLIEPQLQAYVKSSYTITATAVPQIPAAEPVVETTFESLERALEAGVITEGVRRFVEWASKPVGALEAMPAPVLPLILDPRIFDSGPGRDPNML